MSLWATPYTRSTYCLGRKLEGLEKEGKAKITPTSASGCAGVQTDVVIKIDPAPVVATGQTKIICSGANVNYKVTLTPGGLPVGTTYSWPAPTMSAGSPQGSPGVAVPELNALTILDVLTNTSGSSITATYAITPTTGGVLGRR